MVYGWFQARRAGRLGRAGRIALAICKEDPWLKASGRQEQLQSDSRTIGATRETELPNEPNSAEPP